MSFHRLYLCGIRKRRLAWRCIKMNSESASFSSQQAVMTLSLRAEHQRHHTIMALMKLSVLPAPACNLWAAGWWEWVHSVFSQDKGVGKGCPCTPGPPSLPCPGSLCWGCVPSSCSRSRESRTSVQGPWRVLGPGPFPEQMQTDSNGTQRHHMSGFREPR